MDPSSWSSLPAIEDPEVAALKEKVDPTALASTSSILHSDSMLQSPDHPASRARKARKTHTLPVQLVPETESNVWRALRLRGGMAERLVNYVVALVTTLREPWVAVELKLGMTCWASRAPMPNVRVDHRE